MEKQIAGSRVAALKESIKVLAKQLAGMDRRAPGRAELQQRLEDSKAELTVHDWAVTDGSESGSVAFYELVGSARLEVLLSKSVQVESLLGKDSLPLRQVGHPVSG